MSTQERPCGSFLETQGRTLPVTSGGHWSDFEKVQKEADQAISAFILGKDLARELGRPKATTHGIYTVTAIGKGTPPRSVVRKRQQIPKASRRRWAKYPRQLREEMVFWRDVGSMKEESISFTWNQAKNFRPGSSEGAYKRFRRDAYKMLGATPPKEGTIDENALIYLEKTVLKRTPVEYQLPRSDIRMISFLQYERAEEGGIRSTPVTVPLHMFTMVVYLDPLRHLNGARHYLQAKGGELLAALHEISFQREYVICKIDVRKYPHPTLSELEVRVVAAARKDLFLEGSKR